VVQQADTFRPQRPAGYFLMHNASIKERMFLCLVTLSLFVLIVSLLALTIAEDQTTQRRRQKPPPMLGIISDTSSVR
jgi:hypothetical protein